MVRYFVLMKNIGRVSTNARINVINIHLYVSVYAYVYVWPCNIYFVLKIESCMICDTLIIREFISLIKHYTYKSTLGFLFITITSDEMSCFIAARLLSVLFCLISFLFFCLISFSFYASTMYV